MLLAEIAFTCAVYLLIIRRFLRRRGRLRITAKNCLRDTINCLNMLTQTAVQLTSFVYHINWYRGRHIHVIIMLLCFRMSVHLIVVSFLFLPLEGKILRAGRNFHANFAIVDSFSRVTSNCIRNFTSNHDSRKCSMACISMEECKTFNLHEKEGICELLSISKFDVLGVLRRERHWTHYETDDDADEVNIFLICIYRFGPLTDMFTDFVYNDLNI